MKSPFCFHFPRDALNLRAVMLTATSLPAPPKSQPETATPLPLNALLFIVLNSVCFTIMPTISVKLKKGEECDSGSGGPFLLFI